MVDFSFRLKTEKGIPENGNPFDDTTNLAVILAYNRPKYNKQIIAY